MTILEFLVLLLIAAVCGILAQSISGYSAGGLLASIALGFIGALLGMWMARAMRLPEPFAVQIGETTFPIVWSIIGATLFVCVIGLLRGAARRP